MTENDPNRYVGSVYVWDEKKVKEIMQDIVNFTKQNDKMMDYEKLYKEALERAKKLKETCDSKAVVGWCEYIFPELKEQKPAWSEEDEEELNQLHKLIVKKAFEEYEIDTEDETLWGKHAILDNWLKSIKERLKGE